MTLLPKSQQPTSLDNFNVDRTDYRQGMQDLLAYLAEAFGGVPAGQYTTQAVNPASVVIARSDPSVVDLRIRNDAAGGGYLYLAAAGTTPAGGVPSWVNSAVVEASVGSLNVGAFNGDLILCAGNAGAGRAERLRVSGVTGHVGIGTVATPVAALEIQSAAAPAATFTWTGAGRASIGFNSSTGLFGITRESVEIFGASFANHLRLSADCPGIQFNGSTAAANALNAYEEGSWTPTLVGGTVAGVGTYSVQDGKYIRIGSMVTVTATLVWSGHTGSGQALIAGLPFTPNDFQTAAVGQCDNFTWAPSSIIGAYTMQNQDRIALIQTPPGGGNGYLDLVAAGSLRITSSYSAY